MFFFKKWSIAKENAAKAAAISKAQAVTELGLDGTIITANENFLNILGYSLAEVRGKHHSMFVEADERSGAAYREFWARLNRGEPQSAEYKQIGKDGKVVWVQATYNPVLNSKGKPTKVILHANRNAFFYVSDRTTGNQLTANPFVDVDRSTRIDLKTARAFRDIDRWAAQARTADGISRTAPAASAKTAAVPRSFMLIRRLRMLAATTSTGLPCALTKPSASTSA